MNPVDPIEALRHAYPYPYYAALAAGRPLRFDARLGLWLAVNAAAVEEVLCHPDCRVRPLAEPVPAALAGGDAGAVFGALVRMNEGAAHVRPKLALRQALAGIAPAQARERAAGIAAGLAAGRDVRRAEVLSAWMYEAPLAALASLLGFPQEQWATLTASVADFVACLSPLSDGAQLGRADVAAADLLRGFQDLLDAGPPLPGSLLAGVVEQAAAAGWDDARAVLANLVGLLSQTYEATAGLIGNSVTAMLSVQGLAGIMGAAPGRTLALVREVSRYDPPVQNTRRFVARAARVAGVDVAAGQTILLLLAGAARDPALYADPHAFLLERPAPRSFGFGHGAHACPGQALACALAAGALDALLGASGPPLPGSLAWTYRASVNARIPHFFHPREAI
ncbi:MAG TPA: cytochrome [Janthinobacterium sp.]|nr:cytochrome [Janthinobacterium sp.]